MSDLRPTVRDRMILDGRRFLVIDDHGYMLDVVTEILKHFGADGTARAGTVSDALDRVGPRETFDVIVCDFNMKPVNGLQFLQTIRAGKHAHIKRDQRFILLTGHGELDVVRAAKNLDVNGYVVKPVAPDILIKTVERALDATPALKPADAYARIPTGDLRKFQ